ncbi:hypothetical protein V6N12_050591 [Hibiscus sabdariffa]|uniref:Uncharacterized protein n=1 Tax=Hibiscus sabdariffa TaxID=183260 RepID=A0ABR2GD95_9ROSI
MVVCILCVVHVEGPVGAALRPGAIRGGASFVWLASCPCDSLGSPRLEAELPPLRLGFHSASERRPIDLGLGHPWRSLSTLRSPWMGMALSVQGLFPASVALHAWCIGPLGYTDYGCVGRCPGCCFGPLMCTVYGCLGCGPGCCLGPPTIPLPVVLVHGCTLAQPSWQALGCARIVAHRAAPKVLCCHGQDACSLNWLRALLRPFRGLCATLWRGVQVTLGPVTVRLLTLQPRPSRPLGPLSTMKNKVAPGSPTTT